MAGIELLRKEICDALLQIKQRNPKAMILEGLVLNAFMTREEHEEIEKKLARLEELGG